MPVTLTVQMAEAEQPPVDIVTLYLFTPATAGVIVFTRQAVHDMPVAPAIPSQVYAPADVDGPERMILSTAQ